MGTLEFRFSTEIQETLLDSSIAHLKNKHEWSLY